MSGRAAANLGGNLAGLSLRDLEYVIAVAAEAHFGRAAKACGVSQPALSTQVRKLEARVGFAIFERLPGGVVVTREGAGFVDRAARLVADARELMASLAGDPGSLAGPFRLGAIPTLAPYLLPLLLRPLRAAYPGLLLVLSELRTDLLVASVRDARLDAALVCSPEDHPGLVGYRLFHEPMLLMHPAGEAAVWPPSANRLLVLEDGHCLRTHVLAACGLTASGRGRHATGLEILRHMVAAGEGVSLMPALAIPRPPPADALVRYSEVASERLGRDVIMLVRRNDPRAGLLAGFAELFRDHMPDGAGLSRLAGFSV